MRAACLYRTTHTCHRQLPPAIAASRCGRRPSPGASVHPSLWRRRRTSHLPHTVGLPCPGCDKRRQTIQREFVTNHSQRKPLPGDPVELHALFGLVAQKTRPKSSLPHPQGYLIPRPCRVTKALVLSKKQQRYGMKKIGQSSFPTAGSCRLFSSVDVSPSVMGMSAAWKHKNKFQ